MKETEFDKKMHESNRIIFCCTANWKKDLEKFAQVYGTTISSIIREAVNRYLNEWNGGGKDIEIDERNKEEKIKLGEMNDKIGRLVEQVNGLFTKKPLVKEKTPEEQLEVGRLKERMLVLLSGTKGKSLEEIAAILGISCEKCMEVLSNLLEQKLVENELVKQKIIWKMVEYE